MCTGILATIMFVSSLKIFEESEAVYLRTENAITKRKKTKRPNSTDHLFWLTQTPLKSEVNANAQEGQADPSPPAVTLIKN